MLRFLILLSSSVAITGCATSARQPVEEERDRPGGVILPNEYRLPDGTVALAIPELNDEATFREKAREKCGGGIILYPPEENSAGVRLYQCNR